MHLSDEEKAAILRESSDPGYQKDMRLISRPPKMSLESYMEFLQIFSPGFRPLFRDRAIVEYKHSII